MSSCTTNGSSYGFRLIVIESKSTNSIYLLDVYPKFGPLSDNGKVNVDSKMAFTLLEDALFEKQNNILLKVIIEKSNLKFEEITIDKVASSISDEEE